MPLTPQHLELLGLIAEGKAPKQIAHDQGVATPTITRQAERMRACLGAATNAHAVAIAMRRGLLFYCKDYALFRWQFVRSVERIEALEKELEEARRERNHVALL